MAKIALPSILRSLRSASAAEVKAMYQAIASVVNGGLTADNFTKHLRIPNSMKQEPRGWTVLTGWAEAWSGAAGDEVSFAIPTGLPGGALKVGAWGVSALLTSSGVAPLYPITMTALTGSTIALRYRADRTSPPVNLDTGSLSVVTGGWLLAKTLGVEAEVVPGSVISVHPDAIGFTAPAVRLVAIGVSIWLRTEHLP